MIKVLSLSEIAPDVVKLKTSCLIVRCTSGIFSVSDSCDTVRFSLLSKPSKGLPTQPNTTLLYFFSTFHATLITMSRKYFFDFRSPQLCNFGLEVSPSKYDLGSQASRPPLCNSSSEAGALPSVSEVRIE